MPEEVYPPPDLTEGEEWKNVPIERVHGRTIRTGDRYYCVDLVDDDCPWVTATEPTAVYAADAAGEVWIRRYDHPAHRQKSAP